MYKYVLLTALMAVFAYPPSSVNASGPLPAVIQTELITKCTDSIIPASLFSQSDAEEIMGESVHISDNTTESREGKKRYLLGYMADTKAPESDRAGAVYFLYEQYEAIGPARDRYSSTKLSNEHLGIEVLQGIGDEAYFHTDGENFYFVMVRKGNIVFNMKVNKLTATTSLEAFNQVARKIAAEI